MNTRKLLEALRLRAVYGRLLITGNLSLGLGLFLLLPSFMRPHFNSLQTFRIYRHPFITPPGPREKRNLLNIIHEIIGLNQYRVELIPSGGVVIDAGANMGVFSIFAAAKHPKATIYAFEPMPATFEALKENVRHYPNIKAFNCGLGETAKTAAMIDTGHSGGNYVGTGNVPVSIKTIDSLDLPVGFIKIDTEGYESNIIRGAAQTIKRHKPIIVMSAYHKPGDETALPALLNSIAPYQCELRQDREKDLVCKPVK